MTDGFEGVNQTGDGAEQTEQRRDVGDRGQKARSTSDEAGCLAERHGESLLDGFIGKMRAKKACFHDAGRGFLGILIAERDRFRSLTTHHEFAELFEESFRVRERVNHQQGARAFDDQRDRKASRQ